MNDTDVSGKPVTEKGVSVKKFAVLLLTICIAAAALTGCSPKDTETMAQAEVCLEQGDYENAVLLYDQAVGEGKQLQACYRGKGIALMGQMEYESAAETFRKALDSASFTEKNLYHDHMEDDIRKYLASCYIHSGRYEDAILIYDALLEKDDDNTVMHMERGTAKAAAGDLDSAKSDFDRAINLDRKNYDMILEIAQTLEKYGGKKIGMKYFSGVSASDANIDPILRGKILYYLEDYKNALDLLSPFAADDEQAALIACRCQIALGNMDAARDVISGFGSKADSSPELMSLLGSIYMKQRNYEKAVKVYERAVKAAQGTAELQTALYNRIVAYEYAGDFEKAQKLLARYLKQYTGDKEAKREYRFLKTR